VRARSLCKVKAVIDHHHGEIAHITRRRHGDAKESAVAGEPKVDPGLDDCLRE
jgi:hypothetical protein